MLLKLGSPLILVAIVMCCGYVKHFLAASKIEGDNIHIALCSQIPIAVYPCIRLKEGHARQTEKIEKLEKDLAEEKTKCAGLVKDAQYEANLHKLEVGNLDSRLKAAEKDKGAFQRCLLPQMSSTAPARRGEMASMNRFTPESLRDDNSKKRLNPPGSAESP
jgi:hypothetical protein